MRVSCRQYIAGSCVLMHSANLCHLVGEFISFTFKVISDKERITSVLLLCFLFILLLFLSRISHIISFVFSCFLVVK